METSRGQATLQNVLQAFSDPGFRGFAQTPAISPSVRALQSNGATRGELLDFDAAVHSVPGALNAFESALIRVAPHLG
ncbi:MAG: hypothetical protein ACAI38_01760 [Myxococcota bacterium]|nr:hypothetical protein [Myxococcota bacterium]